MKATIKQERRFVIVKICFVLRNRAKMSLENSVQTPQISSSLIQELAKNLYEFQVIDSKQLNGYDDKNYWLKKVVGLGDKRTIWPHGYVLKITNERDSKLEKWLGKFLPSIK